MSDLVTNFCKNLPVIEYLRYGPHESQNIAGCSIADVREGFMQFCENLFEPSAKEGEREGSPSFYFVRETSQMSVKYNLNQEVGDWISFEAFDGRQGGHHMQLGLFFDENEREISASLAIPSFLRSVGGGTGGLEWDADFQSHKIPEDVTVEQGVANVIQYIIDVHPWVFGDTFSRVKRIGLGMLTKAALGEHSPQTP